jgi:hypothetical protein
MSRANIRRGELQLLRHAVYKGGIYLSDLWEDLTIAAAANTSSTVQFPAGSLPVGVNVKVMATMTTAATFSAGISGDTTCFLSGVADTLNATYHGFYDDGQIPVSAATSVLITPNDTPGAADGILRLQLIYFEMQDIS